MIRMDAAVSSTVRKQNNFWGVTVSRFSTAYSSRFDKFECTAVDVERYLSKSHSVVLFLEVGREKVLLEV